MADTISESRACALLTRLFTQRGYTIERNVPFREGGVSFDCDGWDRKARVGFEFLSSQHDDHDDLSLEEFQTLMDAQRRGRLHLLVLDEVETLSVAELKAVAKEFLDALGPATGGARAGATTAKRPAKRPAGSGGTKPLRRTATARRKTGAKAPTEAASKARPAKARPGGKTGGGSKREQAKASRGRARRGTR